ncbi:MAG: hydroxymethylglutaryl-CoA lyase [Alphaproteobacteria bacterium]|nr:hydroxymethylglutaryl-CoA lyase [Alphaproteobacteria bacterium]MBU1517149.1 hydroxymethylglutaryl-CoA lyase [Alphaproteobacteria bacterium]MBU2096518.1 hydroxymethylglutaryl-CoA lyase [Alphaproteobacteria bacterium]MBU2151670.1 hydroxymethylglutaryl-CoA lyase [Alphaproteobacteria bacterium]MBU2305452.1 hydroxymethylglutaryl-CoA lyase [Alphaproteobacteria bacterium]
MHYPSRIHLREVSPRDGLQAETTHLSTADKVAFVDLLSNAGFPQINAVSFVSPKAMPHMADAAQIMAGITRRPGTIYDATVPNLSGVRRALDADMPVVSVFISASLADYRPDRTQDDNLASAAEAVAEARANGLGVIAVVAKAFGCSVEGEIPFDRVLRLMGRLHEAGANEVCLGDTSGEAGPAQVGRLVGDTLSAFPDSPLSLHFHDTRGLGLANVLAAMDAGATRFDSAVGGIGGSPQTRNSTGNISTEDLLHLCEDAGVETGVDLDIVLEAYRFLEEKLGHPLPGRLGKFGRSKRALAS